MSYFELYNKMRQWAAHQRSSASYRRSVAANARRRATTESDHVCPSCRQPLDPGSRCIVCAASSVEPAAAAVGAFASWTVFTRKAHRLSLGARALAREDARVATASRRALRSGIGAPAGEGRRVHLVGRVEIVSGVREPRTGTLVGAYVSRWMDDEPCAHSSGCRASTAWAVTEVNAGALVFESDDGVRASLGIAGAPLRVWLRSDDPLETPVLAEHGAEVELVGTLVEGSSRRVAVPRAGYRSAGATQASLEGPGWLLIARAR